MRLLVVSIVIGMLFMPLVVSAGDIQPSPAEPEPFTAIVPDLDKMQELDRQLEEALREQGKPVVPPAATELPQDNQGDKGDGPGK